MQFQTNGVRRFACPLGDECNNYDSDRAFCVKRHGEIKHQVTLVNPLTPNQVSHSLKSEVFVKSGRIKLTGNELKLHFLDHHRSKSPSSGCS